MTTDIATIGVAFDSSGIDKGKISLDNLAAAGARAETATNGITTASDKLSSALKLAAGAFAAIGISKYIQEAASLSQRYGELGTVLDVVSRNQGVLKKDVDAATAALQKQGISMIESRQTMTRVIQSNIDLADATKLARLAQDAAVVGQMNSSQALESMIHGITSAQTEVLRTIGINANFEQSYARLAKELGVTTSALSEQQKMQARVNVVLEQAPALMGVYEASMENAGKMMRSTERLLENLKVKAGAVFDDAAMSAVTIYTGVLKDLNAVIDDLAANGELKDWSHRIGVEFAGLADLVRVTTGQFGILFKMISDGFGKIKGGDFAGLTTVFQNADVALKALYADGEKYVDQLNQRVIVESMLTKQVTGRDNNIESTKKQTAETAKATEAVKKQVSEYERLINSIKEKTAVNAAETNASKKLTETEKIRVDIETKISSGLLKLNDAQKNTIDLTLKELGASERLLENKRFVREQTEALASAGNSQVRSIQQQVDALRQQNSQIGMTREQIIAMAGARERDTATAVRNAAVYAGDMHDAYIQYANDLDKTAVLQQQLMQEQEVQRYAQQWNAAWSNIEQTGKNAFVQFAAHGKSAMESIGQSIKMAVIDLLYQLTVRKWMINIGASLESSFIGSALGSVTGGAGGAAGGLGSALNLASLGSNAMGLFNTGFGATSMLSKVGGMLPGSVGSFFGGMGVTGTQAAAQAGASALWESSGASAAASMGSSFAAVAGPAIALAAVDTIGRMLAGDKKLGGAEMIPVIGGFMAALFGRGPLKQKETNLIGDFSSDGFSGITSTKFKAQGGLARSSKVDRVMIDTDTGELLNQYKGLVEGGISKVLEPFAREAAVAAMQLGKYLDDVTTSTAESMQKVGESLGKGKDAMEGFYYGVNIASEKGKSLTDEQISGVLADMADTMARHVIPNIDAFRKAGESAADAALRIGNEFDALVSASAVLGVSLGTARTVLQQSSIEGRTAFIEAAGGIDALNSKAQYFAANFLDGSEIIQRNAELLGEQMGELGLSTDMTKEDFKNLVQSFGQVNGISEEMLISLLDIAPLFNDVKTAADAAGTSIGDLANQLTLSKDEMVAVGTVMANVGYSFNDILQVLRDVPAEKISAFVDSVGGIDALLSSSASFAENFLNGAELAKTKADYLAKQFTDLGIRSDLTAQDFKDLVQGVGEFSGVSKETRAAAAALTAQYVELYGGTNQLTEAFGGLDVVIDSVTQKLELTNQSAVAVGTVLGNVGYSFDEIMEILRDLPTEEITAFVQKMGGIQGLLSASGSFAENFLTASERLQVKTDYLAKRLNDLGVSSDLTAEQFRNLVMGQGEFANASEETRGLALLLAKDFFEVNGGIVTLSDSVGGLNGVATAASVSVDGLVQAGLDFGLTMQQISTLLKTTSPADLAKFITDNPQFNQQADFFKQNFLTPDQQFANDSQNLANQLFKAGIDPNISRSGFTAILQDMTAQNNAAARNLMGLFDSVHDRIEASAEAAQNFVAPMAEIINQDAISAAQSRLKDTESALTEAQNQLNQARQAEVNTLQQTVDKYRNYEQAMRNASNALALSAASPLTPMEKYQEANKQLQAAAKSGDYEKLQQAGSAFLEASKLVNASGSQYTADYSFVKGLYDQAAAAAGKQASDAERQLGALGTINNSVLSVAQAVNNLAAAQSAYNAAQSAIPAPIYSTPNVQPPQVLTMPQANFDMSNIIQFPGTSTVSNQQIYDFVQANYGDWKLIYDKAQEYGVSSQRLSDATGIALSDIQNWVTANNLPMFERGTDFVQRGGLAMLHPAEAVTPARSMDDMAEGIRGLKQENSDLKRELQETNRLILALTRTVADSGKRTAEHIVKGSEKQAFYREVKRA